ILVRRLRETLKRINPSTTEEVREQAIKQVLRSQSQKLIEDNESFHKMLVDGVDVAFQVAGEERNQKVWLLDFIDPGRNEFLAVNQFTVIENNIERRPDVILFINGIPLQVLELKNLAEEDTTIWT